MKAGMMYWLAAGFSLLGLVAHEALGAPMVLPPLLTTDLPEEVIWLHNFPYAWTVISMLGGAGIALELHSETSATE